MNELGLTNAVLEEGREWARYVKIARFHSWLHFRSSESAVSEVMEASFPMSVDANSNEGNEAIAKQPAVLVKKYGRLVGIITRHDVLDIKLTD